MTYVELHAHSAYSFLDGASQPEELAARAAELGYEALALTDHDGVYGSLEFAHAAKHFGVRPITGAEVTLADGSHVTLLVESARGYANLCRLLTAAHAHTRDTTNREPLPPRLDQALLEELNEGLVCLSGCARDGLAVRDPNAAARLARAFGRDRFYVELQRPYERGDARRNARLRDLADSLGVRTVATGDVHAHDRRRAALQDVLVAVRCRTSLEGCEQERRGNHESVLLPPEEMLDRFPDDRDAVQRTTELAERLEFDLTEELGYRYPDFSDGDGAGDRPAAPRLRERVRRALLRPQRPQAARAQAARGGARAHRRARPRRLLPPPLGGARARARGRARGARPRLDAARPAARARARLLGRLARLLPDRPLARRPGREQPLARPLPQPRARVGARHRPRLPARHPREAHRPRRRALRIRARLARRGLRDLPLARRDPGRRQGARPPVRRPRAARAPHRRLERAARRRRDRRAARRGDEAPLAALARVRRPLLRDRRPAAPHLPAPGRDGHLLAAARRARARAAGGDGGPADVPVGQGLLRRRRLPQDRPARARDAVGGRGVRRPDRAPPWRADRPLARAARRPGRVRGDPARRHGRLLPDREPRADAGHPPHAAGDDRRHHGAGRARAAGADPGEGRAPVRRAAAAAARRPDLPRAGRPSAARGAAARDARRRRLPGPGARRRRPSRRLHASARRRGCGAR